MQIIRIDQLKNLLESNPKDSFLLFALAKEFEKLGQIKESIHQFENLQKIDENYVGLYYHLGKNYERIEQIGPAIDTYKKGIMVANEINDAHSRKELEQALYNLEIT